MKIEIVEASPIDIFCDTLIIGISDAVKIPDQLNIGDKQLIAIIGDIMRDQANCSKFGETTIIQPVSGIGAKRVLLLGLGKKDSLNKDKLRSLAAIGVRAAQKCQSKTITIMISQESSSVNDTIQAFVEGAILGSYQFRYYKTEKNNYELDNLIIASNELKEKHEIEKTIEYSKVIGQSVNFARDLVNHPSSYMTPTQMARHAMRIAQTSGMDISILEKEDLEEQKMNAFLAVSKGSDEPPKMIVLKYTGNISSNEYIAFVGKGITFDSGGISLKPSANMEEMKGDMAGGAAVLGAMQAIGYIKPKTNIIAVIPCTENMPSGRALKPGDVVTSMSGKTIEIISTDAEGRLVLADAITYARKIGATKFIDVATLTGACVVALGNVTSAIVTNSPDLSKQVLRAAQQTGEKMWEMPGFDEYNEQIKSDIADLKNSGGRMAGAITAGLFISNFVGNLPWVHIDIAGTSDTDKTKGYNIKGATGVGVRTLIQLAENLSNNER